VFGLDDQIAAIGGGAWVFVLVAAVLLGLRHATDPDHLTAVLTLRLHRPERSPARMGLSWGVGHAVTMIAVGVPLILVLGELPERLQQLLEFAVGVMIAFLAIRVLRGLIALRIDDRRHRHDDGTEHAHPHAQSVGSHSRHVRSSRGAFLVGLVHGAGGSAGVVALLLARVADPRVAIPALIVVSVFSAVAMAAFAWGMCRVLDRSERRVDGWRISFAAGVVSLAFGLWYAAAALETVPYPL
jgi:high-affinity nickel permease